MNDITTQLFALLPHNNDKGLDKIKTVFELSDTAEDAELTKLTVNLTATSKPSNDYSYGFSMNMAAYTAYHLNLPALRYLVEERGVSVVKGDPSPLFVLLSLKPTENAGKISEILDYLIENGAEINSVYSGSIYYADRSLSKAIPLHLAIHKSRVPIARTLLLHGANHRHEDSNSSYTPFKLAGVDCNNVAEIYKMMECKENIENAKKSWIEKNIPKLIRDISFAFEKDPHFLIDHLTHQFKMINLGKAPEEDYSYLVKIIDVLVFLTDSEFNTVAELFKKIQESVLFELEGYDVSKQKIKIFTTPEVKQAYFLKLSKGAQWEATAKSMNASSTGASFLFMPPAGSQTKSSNQAGPPAAFTFGTASSPKK
jgi:hypothetical protein